MGLVSWGYFFRDKSTSPGNNFPSPLGGEGWGEGLKAKPPVVDRQLVTFLVLPRKVTKRNRPRFAAAARCPALLDWSGLLINSHDPLRGHVLKHIRQNSLTSLRYSAALRGRKSEIQNLKS